MNAQDGFQNPPDEEIRALFTRLRRIAVVGLSPRRERPSHGVAAQMQRLGFDIVPVRPAVDSVLGEKAYPALSEVPGKYELVDVFRAPQHIDGIVDQCLALKAPALWLQEGVVNVSAARRARAGGMFVVMDRCLFKEWPLDLEAKLFRRRRPWRPLMLR